MSTPVAEAVVGGDLAAQSWLAANRFALALPFAALGAIAVLDGFTHVSAPLYFIIAATCWLVGLCADTLEIVVRWPDGTETRLTVGKKRL